MSRAEIPTDASLALVRPPTPAGDYLFVSPFLILFATFQFWPLVKSLILSLYATNGPRSQVYVGLANFQFLLGDADFHTAVRNTATYAFWTVVLQYPSR